MIVNPFARQIVDHPSAQLPLFNDHPNPLRHEARHYVPVVQNRKGELEALAHASEATWDRLTPLVHFVGPKEQTKLLHPRTVSGWAKSVHDAVGQRACYVDLRRLEPVREVATTKPRVVLSYLYERCRSRGVKFIPVAPINGSPKHLDQVACAIHHDMRGVALRVPLLTAVPVTDGGFHAAVDAAL